MKGRKFAKEPQWSRQRAGERPESGGNQARSAEGPPLRWGPRHGGEKAERGEQALKTESSQGQGAGAGPHTRRTRAGLTHHVGPAVQKAPGSEDALAWSLTARRGAGCPTAAALALNPKGGKALDTT